ncbi:BTB/POZ domain-containing protein 2 [Aphelenchoides avenae]|nr:BTB/POZ domain-containing protein 2 [Aphelenchus avenae]
MADVYFVVGNETHEQTQRIPAHKFVLSIGSAVFDAMFNGALASSEPATAEQTQNSACSNCVQEIRIPDIEPKAFCILLGFLYTDEAVVGSDTVMTTLYTAKKYAVPALELVCVDFLKEHLCAENAFMLLTQARLFDEPHLAAMCLEIIDRETNEALQAEGFCDIDHETLCSVLKRDTLRISELALFQAVIRWAVEACKRKNVPLTNESQRAQLGEALHLIRFPLMPIEEFAQHVAVTRLLSDSELVRFTVDAPIYVLGFGLYGSMHGPYDYGCTIEIINFATGHVLAHNETSFLCDGTPNVFRVLFREPVEIQSGVSYIASAFLARGPDSHYGSKGLRRIIRQTPSGPITFQFSYAAGNNNGTSVDDGQIPELVFCTKVN